LAASIGYANIFISNFILIIFLRGITGILLVVFDMDSLK
jgi:hypothetical protein